jgi:hypothetical protein
MADQHPVAKLVAQETEQARVERVRVEERKRHAERTMQQLRGRFGVPDEE